MSQVMLGLKTVPGSFLSMSLPILFVLPNLPLNWVHLKIVTAAFCIIGLTKISSIAFPSLGWNNSYDHYQKAKMSTIITYKSFSCAHAVPELSDLMSELQDVNDWVTFGLYLGIRMPKLEAIKADCPSLGERRIQMLNEWQKNSTPTWSAVVQALEEIGMRRLASELAQNHGWLNRDFIPCNNMLVVLL